MTDTANIAVVSRLDGKATVLDSQQQKISLSVGSTIREGETIVTAAGASLMLMLPSGEEVAISGDQTIELGETAITAEPEIPDDVQKVLQAIADGREIDDSMESTAAGFSMGTSGNGHDFVRIDRVSEDAPGFDTSPSPFADLLVDTVALEFDRSVSTAGGIQPITAASGARFESLGLADLLDDGADELDTLLREAMATELPGNGWESVTPGDGAVALNALALELAGPAGGADLIDLGELSFDFDF